MFFERIEKCKHKLNHTEMEVLKYFLNNSSRIVDLTIKEIADENFVSANTIVRFAKKLGYDNVTELKYSLFYSGVNEIVEPEFEISTETYPNSSFEFMYKTEQLLNRNELKKIAYKVLLSDNCYVFGVGDSNYYANFLSKSLYALGKEAVVFDSNLTYVNATRIKKTIRNATENDIIFMISASGDTKECMTLLEYCDQTEINKVSISSVEATDFMKRFNDNIVFAHELMILNNINVTDLTGMLYSILRFRDVYQEIVELSNK